MNKSARISLRLNGWRRIAIVLSLLWALVVCAIASVDYLKKENGPFVRITKTTSDFDSSTAKPVADFDPDAYLAKNFPAKASTPTKEELYNALKGAIAAGATADAQTILAYIQSLDYAQWIVDNADKKGTPEFDKVAKAYQISKVGISKGDEKALNPFTKYAQPPTIPSDISKAKRDKDQEGGVEVLGSELFVYGLATPIGLWTFAELLVAVVLWIGGGFRLTKSKPLP